MYDKNAPLFPEIKDDGYKIVSTLQLPSFAGMQSFENPYDPPQKAKPSCSDVNVTAENEMPLDTYRQIINWIIDQEVTIHTRMLESLVDQYERSRKIVIQCLIEEDPDELVPAISEPKDLAPLCGIVQIHIHGFEDEKELFGIELYCNWDDEHGAGVLFKGIDVVAIGGADESYA